MTARTVPELLLDRVAATPNREAFRYRAGTEWKSLNWKDVGQRVRDIATGLRAEGIADEERCAILSGTRIEWILIDLGILAAGGATSTIYPASTPDECAYILSDSASKIVFAENELQVDKLLAQRSQLADVRRVILIDGKPRGSDDWVMTLDELEKRGREHHRQHEADYERIARSIRPEALATLIYTSGTTGKPKGVELTHDCWVYEAQGIDELELLREDDLQFLWLPLAHSFGKVLEVAQLRIGFTTAVDGVIEQLVDNLAVVRPTFVAAVPRIFEKVHNKVVTGATANGGTKAKIFHWAIGVGKRAAELERKGQRPGLLLSLQRAIAHKLVFSKLQDRFGGRLRFFVSGSAPLARELAEFFHAAGVLILEGYGLTESSAASFVNRPGHFKFGTVGQPLPGTQIKIAEDGEILITGRGIMRGYHNMPEATAEALDGRWLRTGDVGEVDAEGFLKITDRKKDLIKTSGGKYVAPQLIEGLFKAHCPYVSQVVVHGDNRNFVTAIVTLDEDAVKGWAKTQGIEGSIADLAKRDDVHALIKAALDAVNAGLPSYATVKKFSILPADLTVENGELTTSLKVRRKVVETKYKAVLDGLYTK
jgi:long-chain acyl-CoA synthetase